MNNEEMKGKADQAKSKIPEEADKPTVSERERHRGKIDKAENKARATAGKARRKNRGHEAVSDQKSHEYH
jgi:uncharacterized protein YjbJ (UPF0337 family)